MSENSSYESVEGTQIKMITENTEVDLAIFYDDIYEQTIVEVIPLGHLWRQEPKRQWQTKQERYDWN
ncbi:MAG: hypothetical protein ACLSB9_32120 [Hydrogeniiclostridium mannosilyticum]